MDSSGRTEAESFRERARAFFVDRAPWSIKFSPQAVQEPVPRGAGERRFESCEANRRGTPPITPPADFPTVTSAAAHAVDPEELQRYLPKGSVYLWAAMTDGAAATDAIAGWIILMAQISCYILLLVNSPKRTLRDFQEDSIIHEPIEKYPTSEDTLFQGGSEFLAYTSENATFIETRHSSEPVFYSLTSISAAVFLVLTFAVGDLRAALALLQTRTPYNMILGMAILASFVLLVFSSLSILFFLAHDNVSFVVGAATVIFISDLDEKMWTALKTVSTRSRLFWCVEAFAVSLVLAIAGITWFGNTAATSAEGIDMLKGIDAVTAPFVFGTGFVFLIAPIGATVGAWEISLFYEHVAERYTRTDAVLPRNLGIILTLNAMVVVHLIFFMFVSISSGFLFLPILVPTAAGFVMCSSCCTKSSLRRLKFVIGVGVGNGISVGHTTLFLTMYDLGLEGRQWSVEYCVVVASNAALSLCLAIYLVKAIRESIESSPADIRALTWKLNCCRSDSEGNRAPEADPTFFGTVLVVWSLYACALFVLYLVAAVVSGVVVF